MMTSVLRICPREPTCLLPQLPVVLDWNVSPPLELEGRIDGQLLAGALAERLGPFGLAWILLLLKVLVALGATELEDLERECDVTHADITVRPRPHLAVVPDELNPVSGIARGPAEEALLDAHLRPCLVLVAFVYFSAVVQLSGNGSRESAGITDQVCLLSELESKMRHLSANT